MRPPRWTGRWSVRVRLGAAGLLVAACGLAGAGVRCGDMPGSDLIALLLLAAIQIASALWSFVAGIVAWLRSDLPDVGVETALGAAMLLAIPAGFAVLVALVPACGECC